MMELMTWAFILAFINIVTATPYGYGVKGGTGAFSRAESSAAAGAFGSRGDIPPGDIPFGNGISGSFSKSSSSSSSSSSASSSSSSTSFNYSGSGAGSFSGPGINGNTGCTSGTCQNAGQGSVTGSVYGYNNANSAAVAGSGPTSGVDCQDLRCKDNFGKCLSGQCQPKQPTEIITNNHNSNDKCTSGICDSTSQLSPSVSQYDNSDDIHFVPHSSKLAHDSQNRPTNDKTTGYDSGSTCRNGNCGPSTINHSTIGSSESHSDSSNFAANPVHNVPPSHLGVPHLNSKCKSGSCETGYDKSGYENPSTSYDVPIHGCKTSDCFGSQTATGTTSTTAQSGSHSTHTDGGSSSASNNKLPIYTGGFGGPPGMLKPDEFDIKVPVHSTTPSYSNNLPSTSNTRCKTANCNDYTNKPSTGVESSSELPLYTGNFGGPSGVFMPNDFNIPYAAPNSYNPTKTGASPTLTHNNNDVTGCKTQNCISSGVGDTTQPIFAVPKPITGPHPSSVSGYTNSHRPIGVAYPSATAVAPITLGYTQPQYPTGFYSTDCKTRNCAVFPPSGVASSTHPEPYGNPAGCSGDCAGNPTSGVDFSTSGPYGSSIPTNIVSSSPHSLTKPNNLGKPSSPQYIGGFDGASDSFLPSGIGSTNCKGPNCAKSMSATSGVRTQSESSAGSKEQASFYAGGFGGPSGFLTPNDYSKPDLNMTPNKASTLSPAPPTCSSGNCNPKELVGHNIEYNGHHASASSSANANAMAYSGGFGGPPGFLTPYDDGKVDLTKITAGHNQGSHYGGTNSQSVGAIGQTGSQSNIGGSDAGAFAIPGSLSSANSGSFGYHHLGNEAGKGIKGALPCAGGCAGGYQNGSQGNGNFVAAGAKSLSTSSAIGVGGSFASSSASAHASAGTYTKGGYGKR